MRQHQGFRCLPGYPHFVADDNGGGGGAFFIPDIGRQLDAVFVFQKNLAGATEIHDVDHPAFDFNAIVVGLFEG